MGHNSLFFVIIRGGFNSCSEIMRELCLNFKNYSFGSPAVPLNFPDFLIIKNFSEVDLLLLLLNKLDHIKVCVILHNMLLNFKND